MGPARPEPVLRLSKGLSKDNPCAVFRPTRAVTRPPHASYRRKPVSRGAGQWGPFALSLS